MNIDPRTKTVIVAEGTPNGTAYVVRGSQAAAAAKDIQRLDPNHGDIVRDGAPPVKSVVNGGDGSRAMAQLPAWTAMYGDKAGVAETYTAMSLGLSRGSEQGMSSATAAAVDSTNHSFGSGLTQQGVELAGGPG